jgi:Zn-dependent M28 family amino/carboxypeptidase
MALITSFKIAVGRPPLPDSSFLSGSCFFNFFQRGCPSHSY